jgi:hypothetical protein
LPPWKPIELFWIDRLDEAGGPTMWRAYQVTIGATLSRLGLSFAH